MRKLISCMIGIIGLCSLLTMTAFSYGWEYDGSGWLYNSTDRYGNPYRVTCANVYEFSDGSYALNYNKSETTPSNTYMIKNGYVIADEWIPYGDSGTMGKWRYFDAEGKLVTNGTTPDGCTVNGDGFWYQNSQIVYSEEANAKYWAMHDDTSIVVPTKQPANFNPTGANIAATNNTSNTASTSASNNNSASSSATTSQNATTATSTSDGLTGFWGSDKTLTYSALRSLYSKLKDPDSLKVKSVKCITFDSTLGSGENVTCRMAIITCYAKNSFGGMVKDEYAYEIRSNGKTNYGDYTKITPYRVMYGDYRDARNIENVQEILDEVIKDYWK